MDENIQSLFSQPKRTPLELHRHVSREERVWGTLVSQFEDGLLWWGFHGDNSGFPS